MTTVYIPRPIRTEEDAEGLPEGTVAIQSWGHGTTARTLTNGRWITPSGAALPHAEAIGFTALVPIEAEEQYGARDKAGAVSRADAGTVDPRAQLAKRITERRSLGHPDTLVSRPVLPWEAVEEA